MGIVPSHPTLGSWAKAISSNAMMNSTIQSIPSLPIIYVHINVKAFDASRLKINDVSNELNDDSKLFNKVASKTVGVKVQRAVDPDVARLLDDSDLSRFGSDVEDLDEDFMVKANHPDGEKEKEEVIPGKNDTNLPKDTFLEEHDKFANCKGMNSTLVICHESVSF